MVGGLLCFLIIGIQASGISIPLSLLTRKQSTSSTSGRCFLPTLAGYPLSFRRNSKIFSQILLWGGFSMNP